MSLDKSQALTAAKQCVLQRDLPAAVEIYRKIVEDDPSDLTSSNTLGDLYVSTGQVQDAIAQFSRVAAIYLEHGFARKAIATLEKIIAVDPANTETATKLADLYVQAGLPSEARQHYLQIADALTRNGATVDALSVFSKIVELDPSNTSTRIKLGELYLREGMNEKAYKEFVTAAEQLSSKGENRRALNAYNEALAIRPDSGEALTARRKLMALLGVPRDKAQKPASRSDVSSAPAGEALSNAGSDSSSHSATTDRGPGSESFVVQEISKAEILVAYGKVNQALAMLRHVLESQPDNIDVHIKLKDIYLRTGMMTEAAHECLALERIHDARGESERARDYAVRAGRLTQSLEQPSGDLPKPKPKHSEEEIEPRVTAAPIKAAPQRDPARKPSPVLTSAPLEVMRPQPATPGPHLEQNGAGASSSQNNRLSFSVASSNVNTVEVLSSSDKDLRPVLLATPADGVETLALAETKLAISPALQSALVPIKSVSADSRERSLPVLFAGSVETKRGRLTALGFAAGVFVLLGAGAVIGGFAYDARLDKQYKELSLSAPALLTPSPPPTQAEEVQPIQENEAITVDVAPPTQTEARQAQNFKPEPSREERPVQPQPANPTPRIVSPPAPMPPRAITTPEVRAGAETRTPAGVPGVVPIGSGSPAEPPPKLVRQSPGVVLGSAIKRVDPGYPATARIAQQAGAVAVEVTISAQGNVTAARALSGPAILQNAAVTAATVVL